MFAFIALFDQSRIQAPPVMRLAECDLLKANLCLMSSGVNALRAKIVSEGNVVAGRKAWGKIQYRRYSIALHQDHD